VSGFLLPLIQRYWVLPRVKPASMDASYSNATRGAGRQGSAWQKLRSFWPMSRQPVNPAGFEPQNCGFMARPIINVTSVLWKMPENKGSSQLALYHFFPNGPYLWLAGIEIDRLVRMRQLVRRGRIRAPGNARPKKGLLT